MSTAMLQAGWVWEGMAFDPGVQPTVFGVGEGCEYFGLDRANFLFHPNTAFHFEKLDGVSEFTADISKWDWYETTAETGRFTFAQRRDDRPERVVQEATTVSELSIDFPNCTGAYIDDTHGIMAHDEYTPEVPARIKRAACSQNPDMDLWIVVYTHEFDKEYWAHWRPHVDVVALWIWKSEQIPEIDVAIARCRELFPEARLNMGVYLRDFDIPAPVPIDLLRIQLESITQHLDAGVLDGYAILSTCMIDDQVEQAEFVRDFIQA